MFCTADDAGMRTFCALLLGLAAWFWAPPCDRSARAQEPCRPILPEQKCLAIRSPSQMRSAHLPAVGVPTTVKGPEEAQPKPPAYPMTLDEAIRIALENSEVIRVLGGEKVRGAYPDAGQLRAALESAPVEEHEALLAQYRRYQQRLDEMLRLAEQALAGMP